MTGPTRNATGNDLVKVAYAGDEAEAELLQGLLRTADVGSVLAAADAGTRTRRSARAGERTGDHGDTHAA